MIIITNDKVAGFQPLWSKFRGFSLLFDNPNGQNLSSMEVNLLKINCSVDTDPNLKLYKLLVQALESLGRNLLINTFLFCPLPPYSYHVTVLDGLNDANAQRVLSKYRLDLEYFLGNLPGSFLTKNIFITQIEDSPLVKEKDWSINFKFNELTKWGNQILVARLIAADKRSENVLNRIISERKKLSERFQTSFGIEMSPNYSPHITLGYFANQEFAELSTSLISNWTDIAMNQVGDQTITFNSISSYGFTDMTTFFKLKKSNSKSGD